MKPGPVAYVDVTGETHVCGGPRRFGACHSVPHPDRRIARARAREVGPDIPPMGRSPSHPYDPQERALATLAAGAPVAYAQGMACPAIPFV
jgi:hypothetical protein